MKNGWAWTMDTHAWVSISTPGRGYPPLPIFTTDCTWWATGRIMSPALRTWRGRRTWLKMENERGYSAHLVWLIWKLSLINFSVWFYTFILHIYNHEGPKFKFNIVYWINNHCIYNNGIVKKNKLLVLKNEMEKVYFMKYPMTRAWLKTYFQMLLI